MQPDHTASIARARRLADEVDSAIEDLFHDLGTRVLNEPDPLVRALVITRALSALEIRPDLELVAMRQAAIRRMRFPDEDFTATPAMGWREIGTLVGLTPTRAQQIADLPGDRTGRRPRRS